MNWTRKWKNGNSGLYAMPMTLVSTAKPDRKPEPLATVFMFSFGINSNYQSTGKRVESADLWISKYWDMDLYQLTERERKANTNW